MHPSSWEIHLNVRSGLISGFLEAIAILIFAPLITRATTNVYNALTTRRVLQGSPVKIRDSSLTVEDLIPRVIRVIRTAFARHKHFASNAETPVADVTRQLLPLSISIVMSVAIVLTSSFIDGASVPDFVTSDMFIWNGGMFVDTTSTGVNKSAADILGMAGVQRACVERVDAETYNLYAAAFSEPQDFKTCRSANKSVCMNGRETKQVIGVTIQTHRIFNPTSIEYIKVEDMEGAPANFTFLEYISRPGSPDHCRVRVSTTDSSTDWTFSDEYLGTRFATRATVEAKGVIVLRAGVAYRNMDGPETWGGVPSTPCGNLSTELFAPNRFTAKITPMGIRQDPFLLELVVADMLREISLSGYNRVESQEVMLRSYYAGAENVDEDAGQSFGTFVPRQIQTNNGMTQITVISGVSVVGLALTILGCFISLLVFIFLRPDVRVTSVSYISRLYNRRDRENQDSNVMAGEVEYIGIQKTYNGSLFVTPVQVSQDYVP